MSNIFTTHEYFYEYINFEKYLEILTNTHVLTTHNFWESFLIQFIQAIGPDGRKREEFF
jgi:hypothetical protein